MTAELLAGDVAVRGAHDGDRDGEIAGRASLVDGASDGGCGVVVGAADVQHGALRLDGLGGEQRAVEHQVRA